MAEVRMEALIRQYDDLIQNHQILPDYNFVEELLSVLPICMKYQETGEAQLYETAKECERLDEGLDVAHDEVAKSCMQFEDRTKCYQVLLNNNHVKKFLDFAVFLKTRPESNENVTVVLKSENDNLKSELEALKLHILMLNSNLKIAQKSLNEEKLQRERIESERKNLEYLSEKLCSLLLKYQLRIYQLEEMKETTTRAPNDESRSSTNESDSDLVLRVDTSSPEDSPDENNFSDTCGYNDELLISPPFNFRDDNTPPKNIDPNEELLKVNESQPAVFDDASNFSLCCNLHKPRAIHNSHFLANSTPNLPRRTPSLSILESDVFDTEIDRCLHSTQEFHDTNSSKDAPDSIVLKRKNIDGLKSTIPDSAARCASPKNMDETNENLTSSQNSNKLSNSTVTSHQPYFECDSCGKYFLKKTSIILHVRKHMKKILLFHCKKCGKSFPMKNSKEKLVKCPTCVVHDYDHGDEHKRKLPIVLLERIRHRKSEKIDDFSEKTLSEISGLCCDICGRRYADKSCLSVHIRRVHRAEKPYECTECGKRFFQKGGLKRHTIVHGSQKPFKCSVCNVGFKDPSAKRRHERIVHQGGAHLQCAHCDKRFSTKTDLISHIHTKHFAGFEKEFKCTICDKSFAVKQHLQRHELAHTSQRSFKCSVCDCYFKYRSEKTRHVQTVHGKGIRFRCNRCDKGYWHKTFLIRHLQNNHAE